MFFLSVSEPVIYYQNFHNKIPPDFFHVDSSSNINDKQQVKGRVDPGFTRIFLSYFSTLDNVNQHVLCGVLDGAETTDKSDGH